MPAPRFPQLALVVAQREWTGFAFRGLRREF